MGENIQGDQLITPVFSTSYFPPLEYMVQMFNSESYILDLNEHYIKQTPRTRCLISTANGPLNLTVPVVKPNGNKTLVKDLTIDSSKNWQKVHFQSIETAYKNAPYYEHYESDIKKLIFAPHKGLVELNESIMHFISNHLDLNYTPIYSEKYIEQDILDFRNFNFQTNIRPSYPQVFDINKEVLTNLSVLDIIFCLGPISRKTIINQP